MTAANSLSSIPQRAAAHTVDVSFIIPVYNEVDNVDALIREVAQTGYRLNRSFEMVLVDDGSRDGTVQALRHLSDEFPQLRVVCLKRNFGQTAATAAGFRYAQGKYFVTLDGDLQNDPAQVPEIIDMLEAENLDIVCGWRKHRQDKALTRKLPSMIANRIIGASTGVKIHDYGCSLKVYRAEVAKEVPLYGEMHRFIPALASIDGAVIKEVPVNHRPRVAGTSKYGLSRTFKVILDLLTVLFLKRFLTRPLHMFGRAGFAFFFVGALILGSLVVDKLLFGHDIGTRPLLLLGVLMFLTGIQLISTGMIAEIQARTYFESQDKPIYKVREIIQHETPQHDPFPIGQSLAR
ncbi:glycosyltransferase family 2 protein [Vampirovibrio chlorellavorus]|uniref:glycosyltransferase family 2 protein n=1 Tax=Vampirovibrio chlorellavorus TaxID=758823 RepID=UPI0026EF9370|nr:glycosyltransferase family 2 protein [Vampirovibrio chlorellavorus]